MTASSPAQALSFPRPKPAGAAAWYSRHFIAVTRTDTVKQDGDMGTVRIDYTFGGPVAPGIESDTESNKPPVRIRGPLLARCLRPQTATGRADVGPAKSDQMLRKRT